MILKFIERTKNITFIRWFEATINETKAIHEAVQASDLRHLLVPAGLFPELDGKDFAGVIEYLDENSWRIHEDSDVRATELTEATKAKIEAGTFKVEDLGVSMFVC